MPHTLLLADDSVTIQRVIELTFADEDVKVIAVSDGDQAIARVESSPPDIVLADIGMPGRNGYEVAKYIKQSPTLSHIPVVLLTGAFEPVDQARASEAGCDGVLAKPFEPQLVITRVKDLLAKSSPQSTPSASSPAADAHVAPPSAPAPAPAAAPAPQAQAIDDYFDRLDAAFQSLSGPSPGSAPPKAESPADAVSGVDWFGKTDSSAPASEPWDVPVAAPQTSADLADLSFSYGSPQPEVDDSDSQSTADVVSVPFVEAVAPITSEIPPPLVSSIAFETPAMTSVPAPAPALPATDSAAPAARPTIKSLPPLADAFAAILAAEQHAAGTAASSGWPATAASNDDLVEQVTRRVLDHLSDEVLRDAVSDIVLPIAERLVREEIERIKASIK